MGQSKSRQRVSTIKENVDQITERIRSGDLSDDNRDRSHEILLDYVKELKFIHSRTLRASRIRKVEKLIIAALQDLATLEGTLKTVEPRLKAKSLQTLHDIEKDIKTLNETLNLETEKEVVNKYKKRISLIEDVDQEVGTRKNEVLDVVNIAFNELASEERLRQMELKHSQNRVDLKRFVGVSDSGSYKKQKDHLLRLKNEVNEIVSINDKTASKKQYLLFNIENNLAALDGKVKANEDKIKKQDSTLPSPIGRVVDSYREFERSFSTNCSLNELEEVFRTLSEIKMKIDQKLEVLENRIQDPYWEWVPVKETEAPVASPRVVNRVKEIQEDTEELQDQITRSAYTKDSHFYSNTKKKLKESRAELEDLCGNSEENRSCCHNLSIFIDEVLILLERNLSQRRSSTTGDLLIDIMSISASVNELGDKIQRNDSNDYNSVECDLLDHYYYLKKLAIPSSRSNVCEFRDYVVIQIESYLSNLESMKMGESAPPSKDNEGVLQSDL